MRSGWLNHIILLFFPNIKRRILGKSKEIEPKLKGKILIAEAFVFYFDFLRVKKASILRLKHYLKQKKIFY